MILNYSTFFFGGTGTNLQWTRSACPAYNAGGDVVQQIDSLAGYAWAKKNHVDRQNRAYSMQLVWNISFSGDLLAAQQFGPLRAKAMPTGQHTVLIYQPHASPSTPATVLQHTLTNCAFQNLRYTTDKFRVQLTLNLTFADIT